MPVVNLTSPASAIANLVSSASVAAESSARCPYLLRGISRNLVKQLP
jgi:hypothetical protein